MPPRPVRTATSITTTISPFSPPTAATPPAISRNGTAHKLWVATSRITSPPASPSPSVRLVTTPSTGQTPPSTTPLRAFHCPASTLFRRCNAPSATPITITTYRPPPRIAQTPVAIKPTGRTPITPCIPPQAQPFLQPTAPTATPLPTRSPPLLGITPPLVGLSSAITRCLQPAWSPIAINATSATITVSLLRTATTPAATLPIGIALRLLAALYPTMSPRTSPLPCAPPATTRSLGPTASSITALPDGPSRAATLSPPPAACRPARTATSTTTIPSPRRTLPATAAMSRSGTALKPSAVLSPTTLPLDTRPPAIPATPPQPGWAPSSTIPTFPFPITALSATTATRFPPIIPVSPASIATLQRLTSKLKQPTPTTA